MSQLDYKPNSCKNCGHPSHCEAPLWEENKGYPQDGNNQYKACDHCSCESCNKND